MNKISFSAFFFTLISSCLLLNSVHAGCTGDCVNGQGRYLYNNGQEYDGSWKGGKKQGQGRFLYKDKSSYQGHWENDLRQGQGIYTWQNGQTYEGQFVANKMNGKGIVKYANGSHYEGDIKEGIPNGTGTMLYPNGQRYQGPWLNNKKHGNGEYLWPSGRKYVGEFYHGKITGKGTYTHNNKSMIAENKPIDPREAEKAKQLYGKANSKKDGKKEGQKNTQVVRQETPKTKPIKQRKLTPAIVKKYRLNITSQPADAKIRILNIKPKYQSNIALLPGDYEIEVSKSGYTTHKRWIKVKDKNVAYPVLLSLSELKPELKPELKSESIKVDSNKSKLVQLEPAKIIVEENRVAKADSLSQKAVAKNISVDKSDIKPATLTKEPEQLNLAVLKDEIDKLKQQIQNSQTVVPEDTQTTATLPVIKQTNIARHALIIGNSDYAYSPLKNPANDASDIAATLKKLNFNVTLKTNVSQEQMEDAISNFGRDLTQGGIGLFYYAGHGVQFDGQNYLIPIKSKIKREKDVRYKAVNLGQVLDEMGQARNGLNVAIIDACRNNPLPRSYRSGQRGLVRVNSPQGTLIAYATSPGATAADGDGRNGLYTKHLLRHLVESGITVEQVLKRVAKDVREESGEKQTPWMESSFTGEFYFSEN